VVKRPSRQCEDNMKGVACNKCITTKKARFSHPKMSLNSDSISEFCSNSVLWRTPYSGQYFYLLDANYYVQYSLIFKELQ